MKEARDPISKTFASFIGVGTVNSAQNAIIISYHIIKLVCMDSSVVCTDNSV